MTFSEITNCGNCQSSEKQINKDFEFAFYHRKITLIMSANQILDYENVNGVTLSLRVGAYNGSANSRLFTISYKSRRNKSSWPKSSLFLAVFFNIVALFYVRISLTALVVIVTVLTFLLFFWITHSVQSGMCSILFTVI